MTHLESHDASADFTILVVEDDEVIRCFIAESLVRDGAAVEQAGNGLAAQAAIRARAPDLVVLDLAMPVMDGWEFLSWIKDDPEYATIPVLIITAHNKSAAGPYLNRGDAIGFLAKPFSPRELAAAVEDILGRPLTRSGPARPHPGGDSSQL